MYPCVLELLGGLFRRSRLIERLKTGQAKQGKAPFNGGLGQIQGFAAEQEHVWQNQDSYRTALGKPRTGLYLGEARALHDMTG